MDESAVRFRTLAQSADGDRTRIGVANRKQITLRNSMCVLKVRARFQSADLNGKFKQNPKIHALVYIAHGWRRRTCILGRWH